MSAFSKDGRHCKACAFLPFLTSSGMMHCIEDNKGMLDFCSKKCQASRRCAYTHLKKEHGEITRNRIQKKQTVATAVINKRCTQSVIK